MPRAEPQITPDLVPGGSAVGTFSHRTEYSPFACCRRDWCQDAHFRGSDNGNAVITVRRQLHHGCVHHGDWRHPGGRVPRGRNRCSRATTRAVTSPRPRPSSRSRWWCGTRGGLTVRPEAVPPHQPSACQWRSRSHAPPHSRSCWSATPIPCLSRAAASGTLSRPDAHESHRSGVERR